MAEHAAYQTRLMDCGVFGLELESMRKGLPSSLERLGERAAGVGGV